MEENQEIGFVIINNIPKLYRSADLRNFFSDFVETEGFLCFHFRHRPEVQRKPDSSDNQLLGEGKTGISRCVTACCVVKLKAERLEEFLKSYDGKHWTDKKGETLLTRCFIKKIKFLDCDEEKSNKVSTENKRGIVSSNLPVDRENFLKKDLYAMIEMHPPSIMPNGNVGTPTSYFLRAIQSCKLPPSLITKLGLQFPRNRSRRIYSNVPFEYATKKKLVNVHSPEKKNSSVTSSTWLRAKQMYPTTSRSNKDHDLTEETDDESEEEEWDRHEAFNDDVTGQERNKERLFENEIELKWEKGGSGLVFYTDAQFWDSKDGDFDAKTADDWDVDTSIYREPAVSSDKDARDLLKMRWEEHLRDGSTTENHLESFASFEKYSTGFGRKILEAQGWTQGQGVGKSASGIAEPLANDGQHPRDKKGFGYRGEKLKRLSYHQSLQSKKRFLDKSCPRVYIPTVFDEQETSNSSESILTSSFFSRLKYRTKFSKETSEDFS